MQSRESRIILLGMILGAIAGGLTVMLMRERAVRMEQAEPQPLSNIFENISWGEVFSVLAAGVALARRISMLSEPADSSPASK